MPLARPPLFTVGWHNALFEHYRITDEAMVEGLLPPGLRLDRHEGRAYLSVVSFRMVSMRWKGWLLPLSHTYPQINVRVYVHHKGVPGVFFLRNHVSHRLAAWAGRAMYGMPYVHQAVSLSWDRDPLYCEANIRGAQHRVAGRPVGPRMDPVDDPTSLPFFLVERYPLYSYQKGLRKAHMYHPPWPLERLETTHHSWAVPAQLGLREGLQRLDEAHCSTGVEVQMWAAEAC